MGKLLKTLTAVAILVTVGAIQAGPVSGQGTWESTLQARDLDGSAANGPEAFYDSVLNLTWLRAGSTAEDTWANGKAWAEQERYGTNGWRLPKVLDTGTEGCDFSFAGGTDCGMNVQTKTGDPTKYESLSGILCARHSMTTRSMYAKQDESEERGDSRQVGRAAEDPQGTA